MAPLTPDGRFNRCLGLWKQLLCFPLALLALAAPAAVVHVYEQTEAGGIIVQIGDTTLDTGRFYLTQSAPAKSGYIFTHWTISTTQAFEPRDAWGRAYDAAPYTLYEDTTFTAHYLPTWEDTDGDGIADGYELYWYGSLAESAPSDSDGDGATFAEEIAAGTNPLFPERREEGPVRFADGAAWLYNPFGYVPYTLRSEPEGSLFATVSEYVRPGTLISSSTGDPTATFFAYWLLNGVRQADVWGRALDAVSLTMPSNAVEIVACTESDKQTRLSLYWYGSPDVSAQSDTDGDGATFAEELAAGTNPLFPERHEEGPVRFADGALWRYNPYNYQPYTLMSDPEGVLFPTTNYYVRGGTTVSLTSPGSTFYCWTFNGAERRDAWGRALDALSFRMPSEAVTIVAKSESDSQTRQSLYWYGSPDVSAQSDTDGDGATFAEELAAGTNPLFPERHEEGPVRFADGSLVEMNLQPYEQVTGAVVADEFRPLFTSPIAGNGTTSETFGEDLQPIVWDLDGDGLFDLLLVFRGGYRTLLNVGYKGNPEFEERQNVPTNGVDLAMNSIAKLGAFDLDVMPQAALSATTNAATLLVSDMDGRIWFYEESVAGAGTVPTGYTLRHKVWGGSHPGFAEGLRLAAVDWEDDGDLDCLCGTADGKLLLLRDPKVGRPTNLKAEAGVDTVVLAWDPNRQSRVRGYRVYRAEADAEATEARIAEPQLPTYRDAPPEIASYDYKVSSVSRFYTAGNSTPTVSESPKTEAVRATLGDVRFFWNDASANLGDRVEVVVSIENALRYDVAGRTESVTYDPAFLRPVEVRTSGLTDGIAFQESASGGAWTVTMTRGVLPAGSGRFLTFVFDTLQAGTTRVGGESGAAVTIAPAGTARYFLGDVDGDGALTVLDIRLLAKLKNGELGRRASAEQVQAGDFNGNGRLDNADYQALRALLKEIGVL